MRGLSYILVVMVVGTMARGAVSDYATYKRDIIDRNPFGVLPPKPTPPTATSPPLTVPPSPKIFDYLRMVAITDKPNRGIRVGIVNIKNKKSCYLIVGETSKEGITLVSGYPDSESCVLSYQGQEKKMEMQGASAAAVAAAPSKSAPRTRGSSSRSSRSRSRSSRSSATATSYSERLKSRREAMAARLKAKQEAPRLTGDELKEHLRAYQMDLIRSKGKLGPVLPMQLTKEMDEQLVKEGVLAPQE